MPILELILEIAKVSQYSIAIFKKNGNDGRNCVPDGWVFPETLIWVSTDKKIIYSIDFRQSSFVWTERHIAILPVSSNKYKRSFILVVGNSVG